MKKTLSVLWISILISNCTTSKKSFSPPPLFPEEIVTDNYFGKEVKDPYRNLENLEDSSVIKWLKDQEKYAKNLLHEIPGRLKLKENIYALDKKRDTAAWNLRIKSNNLYFYLKSVPEKDNDKLYYRSGYESKEIFLFDVTSYKKEYSINYISPNYDGSKVVISMAKGGAEIGEMIILDVASKTLHKEVITNCWPSELGGVSWFQDNKSFIYTHIPDVDKNSNGYTQNTASVLYTIGQDPKKLKVILSKKNNPELKIIPEDFPIVKVIKKGNQEILFGGIEGVGSYSDYYYVENFSKNESRVNWKSLYKKENKVKSFYVSESNIIFTSAQNASNFKIYSTPLSNPDFVNCETLVEEDKNAVITDVALSKDGIYYVKTKNGVEAKLFRYDYEKRKSYPIPIPHPAGFIYVYTRGYEFNDVWIKTWGWTQKGERYRYKPEDKTFTKENIFPKTSYAELEDVVIEEIEVPSHDGVMVPLSIIYRSGLKKDGNNRLLIAGYGAYGSSSVPYTRGDMLHWINESGVFAVAHVRGGGEKGDAWRKGGYKKTKPNTWKDFIACTEYLINEKYTSSSKVAAKSESAGGILIGRAITERPDLYKVAIIEVGTVNTIRREFGANGKNNIKEYGTVKDSAEFTYLLEMDTYHHVKEGVKYPAVYLTAGMNDARVPAWQPGKLAAKMQALNTSENPVLFSVDFDGGHGVGASVSKYNEELVDILSFALWQTGHPDYQLKEE